MARAPTSLKKSDILDKRESTQVKAGLTMLKRVLREGNMQATSAFETDLSYSGKLTLIEGGLAPLPNVRYQESSAQPSGQVATTGAFTEYMAEHTPDLRRSINLIPGGQRYTNLCSDLQPLA